MMKDDGRREGQMVTFPNQLILNNKTPGSEPPTYEETYDLTEWTTLEAAKGGLQLDQPPKREETILISDGREVGIFRIPRFVSVCGNGSQGSKGEYYSGIAKRFEKLVRDKFGVPRGIECWLESMEDQSVADMGQPWDLDNRGRYWLVLSETRGVHCTNCKGTSKQKLKKSGGLYSVWAGKVFERVEYSLGFVSFTYSYDGMYLLEAAVEVRWTSVDPLRKPCFVGLEWDEMEGQLENYHPNQEEKTTTVSRSASRSYSVTGGLQVTAEGPTGGLEMGMSMV